MILEDETYSYISHVRMRGPISSRYYDMTIYRVERATGGRLALFDVLRDCWDVRPLGLRDKTLYLQTGKALPYSEAYSGPVASLNLETGEYTVLLTQPTAILGTVGDVVYVAKLVYPDGPRLGGIYVLNVRSGELKRLSNLPGPSFSTAYEYASLMYSAGGKLYVYWPPDLAVDASGDYVLYAIDLGTGGVERVAP